MHPDSTPPSVTFEQAIALAQALLDQIAAGELSEPKITEAIARLVRSETGARGFFVTYLTDSRPQADAPAKAVVKALQSAPEIVAELLVKNLAMSAATALAHRRNRNTEAAQGSERVQMRTAHLIKRVELPEVQERSQKLQDTLITGKGSYQEFLDRWDYDAEQRQVIQQALAQVIPQGGSVPG